MTFETCKNIMFLIWTASAAVPQFKSNAVQYLNCTPQDGHAIIQWRTLEMLVDPKNIDMNDLSLERKSGNGKYERISEKAKNHGRYQYKINDTDCQIMKDIRVVVKNQDGESHYPKTIPSSSSELMAPSDFITEIPITSITKHHTESATLTPDLSESSTPSDIEHGTFSEVASLYTNKATSATEKKDLKVSPSSNAFTASFCKDGECGEKITIELDPTLHSFDSKSPEEQEQSIDYSSSGYKNTWIILVVAVTVLICIPNLMIHIKENYFKSRTAPDIHNAENGEISDSKT